MEWQAEGTVIGRRPHGETAVIIDVLTLEHGRHAGVVPGGASQKRAAMLQPGARLTLLATDPASVSDVRAFCQETGHELLAFGEDAGVFRFVLRKRAEGATGRSAP